MLAKFSYIATGFVVGAILLLALTTSHTQNLTLSKTSRLNGMSTPSDFVMERFG